MAGVAPGRVLIVVAPTQNTLVAKLNALPLVGKLPALTWLVRYNKSQLIADLLAACIVTVMLIPQSLAYAMLAGLPPELGLYASIWPLVLYAVFGSSRTLSVGPVAVASLMTAAAVGSAVEQGLADPVTAAIALSFISGAFLMLMGLLRLGFMANFLSHGVVSGFITASAILIALSQFKHLLGVPLHGDTLWELAAGLAHNFKDTHGITLLLGAAVLAFLVWGRRRGSALLECFGLNPSSARLLVRAAPVAGVLATIAVASVFSLDARGVALVGDIPSGLPNFSAELPSLALVQALFVPALMIAIIGYVESISVGLTLAAKRRQTINADHELLGLGAANLASGFSGAFPVTGGFSRSVVNFDAGATTQMASVFSAIGIALASLWLTPFLYFLPKATLAATIIFAVIALVDLSIFKKTWGFSRADFWAVAVTAVLTLLLGVEVGVTAGVITSIALFIYRGATPHIAEVGRVAGTEHFRNRERYHVETQPHLLMLRVDESLFFANASALSQSVHDAVYQRDCISDVVLVCTAINSIDYSALETLEAINSRLASQGVSLHLCEVKGPVTDALNKTSFFQHLSGAVYLSQNEAFNALKNQHGQNL